jgi:hypothetical protein
MGKKEVKQAVKECLDQYNKLENCIKDKYGISVEEYFEKRKKGEIK